VGVGEVLDRGRALGDRPGRARGLDAQALAEHLGREVVRGSQELLQQRLQGL
jgi:hypothetical protein